MNLTRIPAARLAARAAFFVLALLAAAPAALLVACDKPSEPGADPSVPAVPPEAPAKVTHILIGFKNSNMPDVKRSKEDALALAKSVIDDIVSGRRTMDELVKSLSDDPGKTKNDGVYTVWKTPPPGAGDFVPAFKRAAFDTPVGKVAPEPVETQYGYHVIRRDK